MRKEVKIALVAIIGLVILYFGMNYLKGRDLFSKANRYYITFSDISGLGTSSPIYADGYKVGIVKKIDFNYDKPGDIIVEVDLNDNLHLPKGSCAEIESDMLGNVKVNLHLVHNSSEYIKPGETITGKVNDGALGKLGDMVPTIESMLPKLDSILGSLNELIADPSIGKSLHNVEAITQDLTSTTGKLNSLLTTANNELPGMITHTNGILQETHSVAKSINKIDVEGTIAKVNTTIENVEKFTAQLNDTQGSLGLLLHDSGLYDNLNNTMSSADSLLVDLKANPKRYVHFSLFGGKNK